MAEKSASPKAESIVTDALAKDDKLLGQVIEATGLAPGNNEEDMKWAEALLNQFNDLVMGKVLQKSSAVKKSLENQIKEEIAKYDKLISLQLNEVMHASEFQALEASWRGLHYFVHETQTSDELLVRVLNVSKEELRKDFENANDYDQSELFRMVYGEEFDKANGTPYGCLIGDYEFSRHPQDILLLQKISQVAAGAHAPFIAAAHPGLLDLESYVKLDQHRDLGTVFMGNNYIQWRSFRESEDSRYVGLVLPHILMRLPYGPDTVPTDGIDFKEDVDGSDHKKYLWGNAAYALGARITDAFWKYGWTAAIRGLHGGGAIEGLPTHTFPTDEGDIAAKCPTEIAIGNRRENELSKYGFIPIIHYKNTDRAVFIAAQSCQKPLEYDRPDATANARLSAQLQYILVTSRFAHYLKQMVYDYIGDVRIDSKEKCQAFLDRWIKNYCCDPKIAGVDDKRKFPLQDASVEVMDDPSRPGAYHAIMRVMPHFQLESLNVSLRLVTSVPKQA